MPCLVREARVPHKKVCEVVRSLQNSGLVLRLDGRRSPRYHITANGLTFLRVFRHLMILLQPDVRVERQDLLLTAELPRNRLIRRTDAG